MSHKILLVDDSELVLDVVGAQLRAAGFTVVTESSALNCSALIVREQPDLVILDVSMPIKSGDEVVRMIRRGAALRKSSVVLYSTMPDAELHNLAQRCGADGFISKGLTGPNLIAAVSAYLDPSLHRSAHGTLLVDDDVEVLNALKRVLQFEEVDCASTGRQALDRILSEHPPELVLCDVVMPGLSGLDVYRIAVAKNPRWSQRIILMTGQPMSEPLRQVARTGAGVLSKPLNSIAVKRLVGEHRNSDRSVAK